MIMWNFLKKLFSFLIIILIFSFLSLPASFLLAQIANSTTDSSENQSFNFEIMIPQEGLTVSGETELKAVASIIIPFLYESRCEFVLSSTGGSVIKEKILAAKIDSTDNSYWATKFYSQNYPNGEYSLIANLYYLNNNYKTSETIFVIGNKEPVYDEHDSAVNTTATIYTIDDSYKTKADSFDSNTVINNFNVKIIQPLYSANVYNNIKFKAEINTSDQNVDFLNFFLYQNSAELKNISGKYVGSFDGINSYWEADFNTTNYLNGEYNLIAKTSILNNFYESETINFYINNNDETDLSTILPTIKIINPLNGYFIVGEVEFLARSNSEIQELTFSLYKDGYLIGSKRADYVLDFNFWKALINSLDYSDGEYHLIAMTVFDGKAYESEKIVFNIKNRIETTEGTKEPDYIYEDETVKENYYTEENAMLNIKIEQPISPDYVTTDYVATDGTREIINNIPDYPPDYPVGVDSAGTIIDDYEITKYENLTKEATSSIQPTELEQKYEEGGNRILNLRPIERVRNDFKISVDSPIELKEIKFKFRNLENGEKYDLLGIKSNVDNYNWFEIIKFDKIMPGNYEVFAEGQTLDGKIVASYIKRVILDDEEMQIKRREIIFPVECNERNIASLEDCEKFLRLPFECRENNITNEEDCERFFFIKYMPPICKEKGAQTDEECERIINEEIKLPLICEKERILDKKACEDFIVNLKETEGGDFTNYLTEEEINNIEDNIEMLMPPECRDKGINDKEACKKFLEMKYMPIECAEQGIEDKDKCREFLKNKYLSPECKENGIVGEEECKRFMFEKYAPAVECGELDGWQCKNIIKNDYLESVVIHKKMSEKIKEKVINKITKTKDLEEALDDFKAINPFKEELSIKIIEAEEKTILTESKNLVQTLPAAIVIDSDEDGLSDDAELSLGTDPNNADTDGDGYLDGIEIERGYNPLVDSQNLSSDENNIEELMEKISPIDQAIIAKRKIEHPKISGKTTDKLIVEKVENIVEEKEEENKGYHFSGKGIPGEFVSLYIYSDLPVIVTTKVDEYGNWKYELKKSLIDGEHEVYVVLNDNTGKVVSKSSPISFFVKEAQAMSVEEFVAPFAGSDEEEKKEKSILYQYILFVGIIILLGIASFVMFIKQKREE